MKCWRSKTHPIYKRKILNKTGLVGETTPLGTFFFLVRGVRKRDVFFRKKVQAQTHWPTKPLCVAQASKLGPVKGLWHAAGILDDHLMADLQREHLQLGTTWRNTVNGLHLKCNLQ